MAVVEVVKYDGSPDIFAWKYPNQELGTRTQPIKKGRNSPSILQVFLVDFNLVI